MGCEMRNYSGRTAWLLLVFLGICGILTVLLYVRPVSRPLHRRALAESYLRFVYSALLEYAGQYGTMPARLGLLRDEGLLAPPNLVDPERAQQRGGYSLVTNVQFSDPPNWLVVFDDEPNPEDGYRHVLFVDGRVGRYAEEAFQELLARMSKEMRAAGRGAPRVVGR